ncbi:type III-B CRISPR module RAMP protein Cmr4 [Saccharolobus shibatae]|uniref:CRISPR-associated RAMP Cmr4 n=1 Tax=Saccharolobus shibatae TaxID=2286 RepID=A0A8F5GWB5_9CREN|nr:type III-B CRISPR module RAMP protein Cmr4 [Saccharolobus shibatae]QXJ31904.1 CRISPR-associated RAMP Cmr4 [Saccharolobus shibatae]QXJ34910.1 CRISPR-associated RAMP Cmr4 [Saccharolobus shibatae]
MKGLLVLAYGVTNLHPGAGRGYGIVDLPVQKDQLGYPIIFSSAFKGPLKALCAGEAISNSGRINCKEKPECCCLFGSEPEEAESNKGVLNVLDLLLFSVPAPIRNGFVQLTTRYLLERARNIFNIIQDINGYTGTLGKEISLLLDEKEDGEESEIYDSEVKVHRLDGFNILNSLPLFNGELAISDEKRLIDRSLIVYTRNRLNLLTKVVSEGGLWSEEYIPMGSTFIGGFIIDESVRNKCCEDVSKIACDSPHFLSYFSKIFPVSKVSDDVYSFYLNIGGKESIGKGLMKVFVGV